MNCEPGDLAVIVSAPKNIAHEIGRIVEVTQLGVSNDGTALAWFIKHPFWTRVDHFKVEITGIADADLRPVRGAAKPAMSTPTESTKPAPVTEPA